MNFATENLTTDYSWSFSPLLLQRMHFLLSFLSRHFHLILIGEHCSVHLDPKLGTRLSFELSEISLFHDFHGSGQIFHYGICLWNLSLEVHLLPFELLQLTLAQTREPEKSKVGFLHKVDGELSRVCINEVRVVVSLVDWKPKLL